MFDPSYYRVNMTEPSQSDLLDMSRDEDIQLANIFCDACGYVSPDFVDVGQHLIECEKLNKEEHLKTYTCIKCRDSTEVLLGLQERELCRLAKSAYEKTATFKPNLHAVPANKIGKAFYDM